MAAPPGALLLLDADRVDRRADRDRRLPAHLARLAEADRVRDPRQRVQPLALLLEHHRRRPARDAVLARVHPLACGEAGGGVARFRARPDGTNLSAAP